MKTVFIGMRTIISSQFVSKYVKPIEKCHTFNNKLTIYQPFNRIENLLRLLNIENSENFYFVVI